MVQNLNQLCPRTFRYARPLSDQFPMYLPARCQQPFVRSFPVPRRPYMCWKDLIEIYQNDYGVSGNRRSCETHLLTFYMLLGLTCCK